MDNFYGTAVEYLWQASFNPFHQFAWMNLTFSPTRADVEACLETFVCMSNATGKVVDDNSLFDAVICLKIFVTFEKVTEWQGVSASIDKKWVQVFMFFRNQSMQLKKS